MRRTLLITVLLSATLLGLPRFAIATQIEVRGAVSAPGVRQLAAHARLSDAALAASVQMDAYMLGAAWLRPSLLGEQQRLRAGVLFDLQSVNRNALKDDRSDLAKLSASLVSWLQTLPATGRQVALLDPRAVEVTPAANRPVADGDVLYYPRRPTSIRVVGAVKQPCELPLAALQDARLYLESCPASHLADPDRIFVVQPDGRVFEQGIALWNRSPPMPLAPGAVIFVPLSASSVRSVAPDLNAELAAFLATQPPAQSEEHP